MVIKLEVKNLCNFKLEDSIQFNRWRKKIDVIRNLASWHQFQLGDIEHRINCSQVFWEIDSVGV